MNLTILQPFLRDGRAQLVLGETAEGSACYYVAVPRRVGDMLTAMVDDIQDYGQLLMSGYGQPPAELRAAFEAAGYQLPAEIADASDVLELD